MDGNAAPIGRRAEKLDALNAKLVNKILKSLDWDTFTQCLGEVCDRHPEELKAAYKQIIDYDREHLWKEFERIKAERELVPKLNDLEERIDRARSNPTAGKSERVVPRPDQVVRAVRVKFKMQELERLRQEEEKLRAENEELMNKVSETKAKLEQRERDLEADISRFQESLERTSAMDLDRLEDAIRALDKHI